MKIGILSDSHGNTQYVKNAGQYLKDTAKVDLIVHLGDEGDDADVLKGLGIEVLKISGMFSIFYQDPALPSRIVKEIDGIKIIFTHSPELSVSDLRQIKAVFYGHTHISKIENKKGILWVNPGHLCEADKRDNQASFAVAAIESGRISANIIKYSDIL